MLNNNQIKGAASMSPSVFVGDCKLENFQKLRVLTPNKTMNTDFSQDEL